MRDARNALLGSGVALAEDVGAGLIAVGSRVRSGIRRALMGRGVERIVCHAHCVLMIIRE